MKDTDKTIQIYSSQGKLQTTMYICYLMNSEGKRLSCVCSWQEYMIKRLIYIDQGGDIFHKKCLNEETIN